MEWEFKNSAICSAREYFDEVRLADSKEICELKTASAWEQGNERKRKLKEKLDQREKRPVTEKIKWRTYMITGSKESGSW